MASDQDTQLEKVIDGVLKSGDIQALDAFLQRNLNKQTTLKCPQQFLTKLDKLISRYLDQLNSKSASFGLAILYKCGKNLKLPGGGHGLPGIIAQGLIKKMEQWFEKCRHLWIQCGPEWDESSFNLSEDFFDALMVIHEACKEGTYKITQSFLYPVGELGLDPRVYILIRKEAIRKFNLILDKIPVDLKKEKKILTSQQASDIMIKMAGQVLDSGDYDLQTALMEALCRMASPDQRKKLADRWFSMEHVANAFAKIRDSEFETDCRKFLNLVNGMQGDKRRVYSYPCLEAYLDKHELLMPADENLEEFWIDFNLGSHSITFYFSLPDEDTQEGQWETICVSENEVKTYNVSEEGKRKVLEVELSEVVVIGAVEGSSLTIHFSSSLDILQAARSVYGHRKNKGFVGKTGTSVVKTTVNIIMEENSSQVVPETQVSLDESEKNTAPYILPTLSAQMVTPAKMRISESSTVISSSAGGSVYGASSIDAVISDTPVKNKRKPSLEMVRSCDRQGEACPRGKRTTAKTSNDGTTLSSKTAGATIEQSTTQVNKNKTDKNKKNILVAKAEEMLLAAEEQSLECIVPDTQPTTGSNLSIRWNKLSVSEMLMMATQAVDALPRPKPHSSLAQQREQTLSVQRFSFPASGPARQKQLRDKVSECLQQVLSEKNEDCVPQKLATAQERKSDTREEYKVESSDQRAATLCPPRKEQAQKNSLAKGKRKGQIPLASDAPYKASVKARALQERTPLRAPLSKEMRDAEVASSMVKLISCHNKNKTEPIANHTTENIPKSWNPPHVDRTIFNMKWLPTAKRGMSGGVSLLKSHSKTAISSKGQRKDVFAFDSDAPLIIGGKDPPFTDTTVISSSDIHDSSELHYTTKKEQPVPKEKRYVQKHLFSDTDTDYAMTEVSWLRDSSRKPKPKVTKYPRQATMKPKAASPPTSHESSDLPPPSPKPVKGNTKPNKKKLSVKERVEQPKKMVKPASAPTEPRAPGRRPKRAAAITAKSYREPETESSESESEKLPVPKCSSADHLDNEKKQETAQMMTKTTANPQLTKSCMELEGDHQSSQSESESVSEQPSIFKKCFKGQKSSLEVPEVKKKKNTSSDKSTDTYRKLDNNNQSNLNKASGLKEQRPDSVLQETLKLNKNNVLAQEKMNALKDSWAAQQTPSYPSTSSIERMRSAERSAPTLGLTGTPLLTPWGSPLPASPDPARQDTPSPVLLLPKPLSAVGSKRNVKPSSCNSAEKKCSASKNQCIPSLLSLGGQTSAPERPVGPDAAEISPLQSCLSPVPPLSLSSQPLLTFTLLELERPSMPSPPQSPYPEDTVDPGHHYGLGKVSQVSLSQLSSKSSVLTSSVKDSPSSALAVSHKTEKTPPLDLGLKPAEPHMSGPSRKRHISLTSNSEEGENKEKKKSKMRGQRSPRMKPRKLFKSFTEVSAETEAGRVMSSSPTLGSTHWEPEVGDGDMDMDEDLELPEMSVKPSNLCQQFSSELKKKFQKRTKMMDAYNKQSWKTLQQHVSSLNIQVTKYGTQSLEQVKKILLEEIQKLEQDDTMLKNMEKDLTNYWKKQTTAFQSYQQQETRRNKTLKTALQSNICPSLEYEQRLFTSQMCLIKKDMKSVQDRLLCEMQEEEVQSVKRGLHALFFPDGSRF
ncbi:LOW QUALITY PROTEIN: synaptonemal complex protein 2 [Mastacembelus armatus]|uniref:LOW QUALITY PROTEIN: synaptonemal complex protein 2 n=1 Tax=Mastacembelus armatus TaxID=205130 RepID=UPI000E463597|nr:LOW QUALITY PROTEIN: synaptonemal complex protein 2-like [Mastacembelus armatus]